MACADDPYRGAMARGTGNLTDSCGIILPVTGSLDALRLWHRLNTPRVFLLQASEVSWQIRCSVRVA